MKLVGQPRAVGQAQEAPGAVAVDGFLKSIME